MHCLCSDVRKMKNSDDHDPFQPTTNDVVVQPLPEVVEMRNQCDVPNLEPIAARDTYRELLKVELHDLALLLYDELQALELRRESIRLGTALVHGSFHILASIHICKQLQA